LVIDATPLSLGIETAGSPQHQGAGQEIPDLLKSTGKEQKIAIKNDSSEEEIERLVQEAERFRAEDDANRARIEAKNSLENCAYLMRNTMSDEKMVDKITADDKAKIDATTTRPRSGWTANRTSRRRSSRPSRRLSRALCCPSCRTCLEGTFPQRLPTRHHRQGSGLVQILQLRRVLRLQKRLIKMMLVSLHASRRLPATCFCLQCITIDDVLKPSN
jgi:hypothetical protein